MQLIAMLPMYDLPEVRHMTDAWWRGLARHFRGEGLTDVPNDLSRPADPATFWRRQELLFAQTCGYPYVSGLSGFAQLVATPAYTVPGCDGPKYRSFIVAREDAATRRLAEFAPWRIAVNSFDSHSGWNVLRSALAAKGGGTSEGLQAVVTGSHRASLIAVRRGEADICAIDCVTFGLIERYASKDLEGTRILAETQLAPGLPYIASRSLASDQVDRLRRGLVAAFDDPELAEVREDLFLGGIAFLDDDEYGEICAIRATWDR